MIACIPVESLDTDEIADLVEDLPPDVVAEVQEGLSLIHI